MWFFPFCICGSLIVSLDFATVTVSIRFRRQFARVSWAARCPDAAIPERFADEIELARGGYPEFDLEASSSTGDSSPRSIFGSALKNFGVTELIDAIRAPCPAAASPACGARSRSARNATSHRLSSSRCRPIWTPTTADRIAFMRQVSGTFQTRHEADALRAGQADRGAFADPVLRAGPRDCRHGRGQATSSGIPTTAPCGGGAITLSERNQVRFTGLPQLRAGNPAPRAIAAIRPRPSNCARHWTTSAKRGVIQVFYPEISDRSTSSALWASFSWKWLVSRLEAEYKVEAVLEPSPFATARWIKGDEKVLDEFAGFNRANLARRDRDGDFVFMAKSPVGRELSGREEPGADLLGDEGAVKGESPRRRGPQARLAPCCKEAPAFAGDRNCKIGRWPRRIFGQKHPPCTTTRPHFADLSSRSGLRLNYEDWEGAANRPLVLVHERARPSARSWDLDRQATARGFTT